MLARGTMLAASIRATAMMDNALLILAKHYLVRTSMKIATADPTIEPFYHQG